MAIRSFVTRQFLLVKLQDKMSLHRGARRGVGRGGRGAGRTQPEEQPALQEANPNAPAAPVQAQTVPPPAAVGAQPASVQLSAEAKHLRDFRKYMKCPEDQKVQCAVFFLEDRGTALWETADRMLGGDYAKQQEFLNLEQGDMTVEQYNAEFDMLSRFSPDVVKDEEARTEKFVRSLRLDLQGIVRALRPTTHTDALRLALDLSLHERADSSKAASKGSALGQKRKVELQPDLTP
ncbi:gag-protease polyprotein [Cucumis melo var. makuwa]|uniref:Gag-protease polyprotein n=1 Tax=Cucumis melo var. makuwa TaxID=1194695 RepID=A0A5A7V6Z3_CUCMM|nr:gag-protease polyprotein [Cucumis melo var. makuwa]TYK28597.1 gag-protease polyprotein [Cucumis melo var. makuwa]